MKLKVLRGRRDEIIQQEIEALTRFICTDDQTAAREAYQKAVAIDVSLRPRGKLKTVTANRSRRVGPTI